jgi:hypothetical protein
LLEKNFPAELLIPKTATRFVSARFRVSRSRFFDRKLVLTSGSLDLPHTVKISVSSDLEPIL